MRGELLHKFRELCRRNDLAFTHQRGAVYEALYSMRGHPTPEELYARVREQVPSISLATVYKIIHTFLAAGIVQEVSLHHGPLRVEGNPEPHHHMVCTGCKSIVDIDEVAIGPLLIKSTLPQEFTVQRLLVEVQGICAACAALPQQAKGLQLQTDSREDAPALLLKRLAG